MFMHALAEDSPPESLRQYRSILKQVYHLLSAAAAGAGIDYTQIDDKFISKMRPYFLKVRGITPEVWNSKLYLILRMCQWAQDRNYCHNLIGKNVKVDPKRFRIHLPDGRLGAHKSMANPQGKKVRDLPTAKDLDLVEAEVMRLLVDTALKLQYQLIFDTMRETTLRGSEVVGLLVSQIPSRRRLEELRAATLRSDDAPVTISIPVKRSKKGGRKNANFSLTLLERWRDFIDFDRLPKAKRVPEICVSRKTGRALKRQAITNLYKRGAAIAASKHVRTEEQFSLKAIRPHHYRHRSITDLVRGFLDNGMDADKAILTVMDLAGIVSLDTIAIYLHLAELELERASDAYKATQRAIEARARLAELRGHLAYKRQQRARVKGKAKR